MDTAKQAGKACRTTNTTTTRLSVRTLLHFSNKLGNNSLPRGHLKNAQKIADDLQEDEDEMTLSSHKSIKFYGNRVYFFDIDNVE